MILTSEQEGIIKALAQLPPPATVRQISEIVNREVTARDIRLLGATGLVAEVNAKDPPKCRFLLAAKGQALVNEWGLPPLTAAEEPEPTGHARRMTDDDKARLYARFAAGEGFTVKSAQALAAEIGFSAKGVVYQRGVWEKAGRPGVTPAPEIEQPGIQAQQGSEGAAFGHAGEPAEIEQGADGQEAGEGMKQYQQLTAADVMKELEQRKLTEEAVSGALIAESVEPGSVQVEGDLGNPDPTGPRDLVAANLLPGGQEQAKVEPIAAVRPLVTTAPTAMALALQKAGVAPTLQEAGERLPEVGHVYEGVVEKVDEMGGHFALINLTEFYYAGKWIRGRVTKSNVLRSGWCIDVRDWLRPGDLVNVKVLAVMPASGLSRPKAELSIKAAPSHPEERIPLEADEQQPVKPEQPISARGADVAKAMPVIEPKLGPGTPRAAGRNAIAGRVLDKAAAALGSDDAETGHITEQVAPALFDQLLSTAGLCPKCVKADICPLADFYSDPQELPEENRVGRLAGVKIVFGPRPVTECSAHLAG
ncbi:MAG TPA: hypothetical protein VGK74_22295 [Symbiobacteriaceae bacterium]|jgi:predicted RNA-binding protein with RPS1 domain